MSNLRISQTLQRSNNRKITYPKIRRAQPSLNLRKDQEIVGRAEEIVDGTPSFVSGKNTIATVGTNIGSRLEEQ